MAYPLRHDINLLADERKRLTDRLAIETAKVQQLNADIAEFDSYIEGFYDVQGSDGPTGTTAYAQGGIAKVNQMLNELDA